MSKQHLGAHLLRFRLRLPRRRKALCRRSGAQAGFGLIELMMGVLLLLVLMAGFVPVFLQGMSQSAAARYKSIATNIAREEIEHIRQLDYREITAALDDPDTTSLYALFGGSGAMPKPVDVPERNMTFYVDYEVVEANEVVDGMPRAMKSVQVTVTWNAPPRPSPAVLKTLIAQQYLGPKGSWLEITNSSSDPALTPFPLLATNGLYTTVKYHIAESDWFLAYPSLELPLPAPNDIYLKSSLRDDTGRKVGDVAVSAADGLRYASDGDPARLQDVWFEYSFDARLIPDGYWDLLVTMFNKYDQPGNTWEMRVRVEKGAPEAPASFVATATSETQVLLSWLPGPERDRARYVLERQKQTPEGAWPVEWTVVNAELPLNSSAYLDTGIIAYDGEGNLLVDACVDPWGLPGTPNTYRYRIYGVDNDGNMDPGSAAMSSDVALPASDPAPLLVVPPVTNLHIDAARDALESAAPPDTLGLAYTVTEIPDSSHDPGTVLSQDPEAGSQVPAGTTVLLEVAKSTSLPVVLYDVTISTTNKKNRSLQILNAANQQIHYATFKNTNPVELDLRNGTYNFVVDGSVKGSFTVSGQDLDLSIP